MLFRRSPGDFEAAGAEGPVAPIMSEGLPASHVSGKRQSLEGRSGTDAEEQSDCSSCSSCSSRVASKTSIEDYSDLDKIESGILDGNAMDSSACSWLSSVASSAPIARRRTWTLCLHFDRRLHRKEVIDDQIRFFLANDLQKAGHSVDMEGRCMSKLWGGYLQREVYRG